MLETDRRTVYFFDFVLESFPAEAPRFEIKPVLDKVHKAYKNNAIKWSYRNNELTVRIAEMTIGEEFTSILVHLSDIKASDPAFSNTITGDVRIEEKKSNEGIAAGCHIVIRHIPLKERGNKYLTVIEDVRGVPRSVIQKFLTNVFRNHCSAEFIRNNDKKKPLKCRPVPKLAMHGRKTLKEALQKGVLTNILLLDNKEGQYFDDDKELQLSGKQLRIKVVGEPSTNHALELINQIKKKFSSDYNQIRLAYSEVVGTKKVQQTKANSKTVDVKKQRSIEFDSNVDDLATELFAKSEVVMLKNEIGQCEKKLHSDLQGKMVKLLKEAIN